MSENELGRGGEGSARPDNPGAAAPGVPGAFGPGASGPGAKGSGTNDPGARIPRTDDSGTGDTGTGNAGTGNAGTRDAGTGNAGTRDAGTRDAGRLGSDTLGSDAPTGGTSSSAGDGARGADDPGQPASAVELLSLRRALYDDLARMHEMRSQLDATEARALSTLRHLEVAARLERAAAEAGPLHDLTREDLRVAEDHARSEVGAEWALLARSAPATGERRVEEARLLVESFPEVYEALATGRTTMPLARVVCEEGAAIDDPEARATYAGQATELATSETMTPSRLRPRTRRLAERAMASTREERHRRAAKRRNVVVVEQSDGMSELIALLPSVQATGMFDRLTQAAKLLSHPDDPRSFDELRADTLAALVLTSRIPDIGGTTQPVTDTPSGTSTPTGTGAPSGTSTSSTAGTPLDAGGASVTDGVPRDADGGTGGPSGAGNQPGARGGYDVQTRARIGDRTTTEPGRPRGEDSALLPGQVDARVMVVVPVLSLLGLDDEPATLDGMTPISLTDAALLAAHAPSWTRVLTCPMTGAPLAVDTYRPNAEQRAFLSIRDQHCRFPGCRRPATRCDTDHTSDWANGGTTDVCNLACLCPRHHQRKHLSAWTVRQRERGTLEWTSPTGRRVTDSPVPPGPSFTPARVERLRQRAHANLTTTVGAPGPPPF